MIGTILNSRYKVTELLGKGGMANVYRATDEALGRTVAVKVMLAQYSSDEAFTTRFKTEAAAAANLQNNHIVQVYDWGFDSASSSYFIVMEMVRGSDLKSILRNKGALLPGQVANIASQVSEALSAAHAYGIVHRDIKPHNIIITPDGNIKVMDFGIAYFGDNNLTQDGSVLGSAYYVSPEQAKGKQLTAGTDIYSLGVVMYEAATGKLPFSGDDAVSVALKQINDTPAAPINLNAKIEPALNDIILKCLEKNPAARYQSSKELHSALQAYMSSRGQANRRQNSGQAGGAPARAALLTPTAAPAATTVMPVIPARAAGATNGDREDYSDMPNRNSKSNKSNKSNQRQNQRQSSNRKRQKIVLFAVLGALVLVVAGVILITSLFSAGSNGNIRTPHVIGATVSQATNDIEKVELKVGNITYQASDSIDKDKVISQDPQPDVKVNTGDSVNLVVSTGKEPPKKTTVPNLLGLTPQEAESALTKANLKFAFGVDEWSETVDSGAVSSQEPKASVEVDEGTKVTYNISKGGETFSVPYVEGKSKSEAQSILENAGFSVSFSADVFDKEVAAGDVVSQDKVGGEYQKGATVVLAVSKGVDPATEQATVPNLVGLTKSKAAAAATKAGFAGITSDAEPTSGQTVISQTPSAGSKEKKTMQIEVVYG